MKENAKSSSRYALRDAAIIHFVAGFGAVPYRLLSAAFFEGKGSGHVCKRLSDDGLLTVHKRALPGGITYTTVTEKGAESVGLSKRLAGTTLQGRGLDTALGTSWFSVMRSTRSYPLLAKDFGKLFSKNGPPKNTPHVIDDSPDDVTLYRVYLASSGLTETIAKLKHIVSAIEGNATLRPWLHTGSYKVAALTSLESELQLKREVEISAGLSGRVYVAAAPTASTLSKFLKREGTKDA